MGRMENFSDSRTLLLQGNVYRFGDCDVLFVRLSSKLSQFFFRISKTTVRIDLKFGLRPQHLIPRSTIEFHWNQCTFTKCSINEWTKKKIVSPIATRFIVFLFCFSVASGRSQSRHFLIATRGRWERGERVISRRGACKVKTSYEATALWRNCWTVESAICHCRRMALNELSHSPSMYARRTFLPRRALALKSLSVTIRQHLIIKRRLVAAMANAVLKFWKRI